MVSKQYFAYFILHPKGPIPPVLKQRLIPKTQTRVLGRWQAAQLRHGPNRVLYHWGAAEPFAPQPEPRLIARISLSHKTPPGPVLATQRNNWGVLLGFIFQFASRPYF